VKQKDKFIKRVFDIALSAVGIIFLFPIIAVAYLIASFETRSNGLFIQKRVGKDGKLFNVYKIKTMKQLQNVDTTITTKNDVRITKSGSFFRTTKIDELPQLFNVFKGDMSFVGPRPDVAGYADKLQGEDRIILSIRPGITGPASIKYKSEEELLAKQKDPKHYNDTVIWPDKVKINRKYVYDWSFVKDLQYIKETLG
jgi:lipopolysaccharide/colanic/teichoic acid biosynthesis glycosyltransferase